MINAFRPASLPINSGPADRWSELARALASLGLEDVCYASFEEAGCESAGANQSDGQLTRVSGRIIYSTWERHAARDRLSVYVRRGGLGPQIYDRPQADDGVGDGGPRSAVLVPLSFDGARTLPTAGMLIGSRNGLIDGMQLLRDHGSILVALSHIFHGSMTVLVRGMQHSTKPLSRRERDCLQCAAVGMRTAAIAESLGLAYGTVDLYLRNARLKLKAATLASAVARGLYLQHIQHGPWIEEAASGESRFA